jgi:peptide/nickel transport system substrate-binding protein
MIIRNIFKAVSLAAALGLAGSVAAQSTLRIGLAEDPDELDPTKARTYVGRIVFASLCDKLFDIDEKLNLVPQLALSQETSADGKAVTIKLRPGVKFHDGEPMDAAAVKYSLDRHLNLKGSFRRAEIAQVDTVEVVDPLTVRLNLKTPFAPLMAQLTDRAGMMVSPKAAEALGDRFGTAPVCAGPYRFVERVAQDRIVVERFADYWDKARVHIDRIIYRPIQDSTVPRSARTRSCAWQPARSWATRASPSTSTTVRKPTARSARMLGFAARSSSLSIGMRSIRWSSTACKRSTTNG